MLKSEALEKGIAWICNQCEEYSKLDVNSKINLKSEIAYYWRERTNIKNIWKPTYFNKFQKHIQPIFQNFNEKIEKFIDQEYLFSRGL